MGRSPTSADVSSQSLQGYRSYVCEVEELAKAVLAGRTTVTPEAAVLDGAPSRALRRLASREWRREGGAFFTTSALRDGPFRASLPRAPRSHSALDPACGAGDLLLRWSDRLPTEPTLAETLDSWGRLLCGIDREAEFVHLARARLVLAASLRTSALGNTRDLRSYFPSIEQGEGVGRLLEGDFPSWALLNPPFGTVRAPDWYDAGTGLVSQAAVFMSAWLAGAASGARLVALLPDVLRTGSRYGAWRETLEAGASIQSIQPLGQFDVDADIDVFLISLRRAKRSKAHPSWWPSPPSLDLSDLGRWTVSCGPVVPHRHAERGRMHRFLTASNAGPAGTTTAPPRELRAFDGTVFTPPFVVVKRTSRPGQRPRARAVAVEGVQSVAVENHLIVLRPESGGLDECERFVRVLESEAVSEWLDGRLGGRHLSTLALEELLGNRG